ncbi:MAG TPA: beta-ketoacyl synthase N-terminal-like domain-containing protein, partial [Syntrophorhabdaceae bacterium]|nr:beta-ketoacyl synthase N-terminal-like domain-containing protein [Syntrophorhabdaceae bacterium]
MKRRVVVTGVGLVTPLGVGIDNVWQRVLKGESGIGPITRFDTTRHDTKFAGEVKDFKPEEYMSPKEVKRIDLFIQYALAGAKIAVKDSGLDMSSEDAERAMGVYIIHTVRVEFGISQCHPYTTDESFAIRTW